MVYALQQGGVELLPSHLIKDCLLLLLPSADEIRTSGEGVGRELRLRRVWWKVCAMRISTDGHTVEKRIDTVGSMVT